LLGLFCYLRKFAGRRHARAGSLRKASGCFFTVCGAWHTLAGQMYAWGKPLLNRVGEVQAKTAAMFVCCWAMPKCFYAGQINYWRLYKPVKHLFKAVWRMQEAY